MVAFSGTLPATRVALPAFGPVTVGIGRAVVASVLAAATLLLRRAPRPTGRQWRRIAVVALGVVIGFPVLSALALQVVGVSHGAVLTGLLPVATAVVATVRAGERPRPLFWLASLGGTGTVVAFSLVTGAGALHPGDLLLLAAVVAGAFGYTDGALLAREMPGSQVICWALLAALPVLVPVTAVGLALRPPHPVGSSAWIGFGYVAVVSMFLGFFAWYHGLARGGVARVGQLQLAQPVLTLLWAAVLLDEHVGVAAALTALGVLAFTALTQRARAHRPATQLQEAVPR